MVYPKEIFPDEVQSLAALLPMTHSLEAVRRALLGGADLDAVSPSLTYLGCFSALGIPLSLAWFRWAVDRARRSGSLAGY